MNRKYGRLSRLYTEGLGKKGATFMLARSGWFEVSSGSVLTVPGCERGEHRQSTCARAVALCYGWGGMLKGLGTQLCWELSFRVNEQRSIKLLRKKGGNDRKNRRGEIKVLKYRYSLITVIIRIIERDI